MFKSNKEYINIGGNQMKKLWLVLFVPLILGCIGGGDDDTGTVVGQCIPEIASGLEINNFYPDLYEVYADEGGITLTMEVENVGSSEATKIEAELFNLAGFGSDGIIARISDMEVPEEDMPVVTDDAIWDLTAPSFGTATDKEVEVGGALYYDYTSRGQASAIYIPSEEWRKMRQEGTDFVDVEQDCSNGPVVISVEPLRQPVTDTREFTVRFVIANLGSGKVKSDAHGMDVVDKLTVTLPQYLKVGSTCDLIPVDATATDEKDYYLGDDTNGIKLTKGTQKVLNCKLQMLDTAPTIRQATHKIEALIDYRYSIEDTAPFHVTEQAHTLTLAIVGTPATTWSDPDGTAYTLKLDPRYDGKGADEISDFYDVADDANWVASMKNDITAAYDVECDATLVDTKYVQLECNTADFASLSTTKKNQYTGDEYDITLTVELDHEDKRATAIVEDINLEE